MREEIVGDRPESSQVVVGADHREVGDDGQLLKDRNS